MTFCADDEPETWKPIEGFPGYEVSDQGRVRSYFAHRKGHWTILEQPRRLLRPGHTSGGHLCVILRKDQRDHSRSVSRLVAQAFIGPRRQEPLSCTSTVTWKTTAPKTLPMARPAMCTATALLAPSSPRRKCWKSGDAGLMEDPRSIAAAFGISPTTLNKLCRGDSWRYVDGPIRTPKERLSDDDVRAIRIAHAEGTPRSDIMARWNVSESHLSLLVRGKRRRKAGGPICG